MVVLLHRKPAVPALHGHVQKLPGGDALIRRIQLHLVEAHLPACLQHAIVLFQDPGHLQVLLPGLRHGGDVQLYLPLAVGRDVQKGPVLHGSTGLGLAVAADFPAQGAVILQVQEIALEPPFIYVTDADARIDDKVRHSVIRHHQSALGLPVSLIEIAVQADAQAMDTASESTARSAQRT